MPFGERPRRSSFKFPAAGAAGLALTLTLGAALPTAQTPDDGRGAFHAGRYQNLFAEQGHAPAETKAKIDRAFQQLFHGDAQASGCTSRHGRTRTGRWPTSPTRPTTTPVARA